MGSQRHKACFLCLLVLLPFGVLASTAGGEALITKSGARWEGKIEDKGDAYLLTTPKGEKMRFPKEVVREVITREKLVSEFQAMAKGADLTNDGQVADLVRFAEQADLIHELKAVLACAFSVRRRGAEGKAESLDSLAKWCQGYGLTVQAQDCGKAANRVRFATQAKTTDLKDDARLADLLEFAAKHGMDEERKEILHASFTARRAAAEGDSRQLRALVEWCRKYGLTEQAADCEPLADALEYKVRLTQAGSDLAKLDELIEWCWDRHRASEREQCLEVAYSARKEACKTPEDQWDLAVWCGRWNKLSWGEPFLAPAFHGAVSSGNLALLERMLGQVDSRFLPHVTLPACVRAIYPLKLKASGQNPSALAELALWCRTYDLKSEGDQAEVDALQIAKDDAKIRQQLGYLKDPLTGQWVKNLYDGCWRGFTAQGKSFEFEVQANACIRYRTRYVYRELALRSHGTVAQVDQPAEESLKEGAPIVGNELPELRGGSGVTCTIKGCFLSSDLAGGTLTFGEDMFSGKPAVVPWFALRASEGQGNVEPTELMAKVYLLMARSFIKSGKLAEARVVLEQIVQKLPSSPYAKEARELLSTLTKPKE